MSITDSIYESRFCRLRKDIISIRRLDLGQGPILEIATALSRYDATVLYSCVCYSLKAGHVAMYLTDQDIGPPKELREEPF